MNKYIQSYKELEDAIKVGLSLPNSKFILKDFKELADKETPRYPKLYREEWGYDAVCPICNEYLEGEEPYRCVNCGQRIEWENYDE